MALPSNIRINVRAPFPSLVQGSGAIGVTKANGKWTIGLLPFNQLQVQAPPASRWGTDYVVVYDAVANAFIAVALSSLGLTGAGTQRSIATSADLPIATTDSSLNLALTAPLAIPIPLSTTRNGQALVFKDVLGNWDTNSPTFNRTGGDTFDGLTTITSNVKYGWIEFTPLNDGVHSGYKLRSSL